jgi:multisubunit Na+/H+ antiporter MnhG subunit
MREHFKRITGPTKIGLSVGALSMILAILGWLKDSSFLNLPSLIIAIAVSLLWGLIAWAIAQAAYEVSEENGRSES